MSTSIRIKDTVYKDLELNTKGFQSVSDTIEMTINSHEILETIKIVEGSITSSEERIKECGSIEKNILLHYKKDNVDDAMKIIKRMFFGYKISHHIEPNCLTVSITG